MTLWVMLAEPYVAVPSAAGSDTFTAPRWYTPMFETARASVREVRASV